MKQDKQAARFTPGPWFKVNDTLVRGSHGEPVASTKGFAYPEAIEHAANAHLIAAAPALYAALEAWLECTDPKTANVIGGRVADYRKAHEMARSALATARGEG